MSSRKKNRQPKPKWEKKTLKLKDNHTWNCPTGYKIFVADRGAISFNIPGEWHIEKLDFPIEIYDQAPPDDETRLSITYWQFPPGIDWSGLPLDKLLSDALLGEKESELETLERDPIKKFPRDDIEIYWTRQKFIDPEEKREAYSRIAAARGFGVTVLFTMDYWVTDAKRVKQVWQQVLLSTQLGRKLEDPTKGQVLH